MKKINLEQFRGNRGRVHFIGCAGAGTQPLLKIFHAAGFRVSGSDLLENAALTALKEKGIPIALGHCKENLPPDDGTPLLLIHSSAVPQDNPELLAAKERNAVCIRRGEALGMMSGIFKRVVSVSGSHGKTSVTAMLAYALHELNALPGCLIGGAVQGWDYNGEFGSGEIFVTEVDESDGTHASMYSGLGIVTNVEDDHAWSVGGVEALMNNFRKYAANSEKLLYVGSDLSNDLFSAHPEKQCLPGDPEKNPDLKLFAPEILKQWGRFQKLNALTALAALEILGFEKNDAVAALSRFPGVERRMSLRFDNGFFRVVEDYAHHPTELAASMEALRSTNPGRRLVIVFQPHRYARLERYFNEFSALLRQSDKVFITPVFAAWTASGTLSSRDLAASIGSGAEYLDGSWEQIADTVHARIQKNDLVAVIGAGDLKEILPHLCR